MNNNIASLKAITRGRVMKPPRILLYGMEGIGKSTFAANMPDPIFVQTEDGLDNIDCAKFPLAATFDVAFAQLEALRDEPNAFKTVVIDSVDWLERHIFEAVCREKDVDNIEEIGYGKGYVMALTWWRRLFQLTDELRAAGKMTLFLAHAVQENYSDPEVAQLTRFTPRLDKRARSLMSEYVDLILLATREFGAARADSPRIVRTEAAPQQVAKSRYAIPPVLPLDANAVLNAITASMKQEKKQ